MALLEIRPLDCLGTTRECALKLLEEASEACEAMKVTAKKCEASTTADALKARVAAIEELADVMQVVCNCLSALGVAPSDLKLAMDNVDMRNLDRGRCHMPEWGTLEVDWTPADD